MAGIAWWILRDDELDAHVITIGDRTAVLVPVDPSAHSANELRLLRAIQNKAVTRAGALSGASSRPMSAGGNDAEESSVVAALGVDYAVEVDVHEVGDRLRASLAIVPASQEQLSHREQLDAASADHLTLVNELSSHTIDDLGTLLDDRSVKQMSEWGTKSVHAYRYAREGDSFQRIQTVESLTRAAEQFRLALGEDPNFAYGYLSLAATYQAIALAAADWQPLAGAPRLKATLRD